nr:hypothetical protein [Tanacetum cinerariifolium]
EIFDVVIPLLRDLISRLRNDCTVGLCVMRDESAVSVSSIPVVPMDPVNMDVPPENTGGTADAHL